MGERVWTRPDSEALILGHVMQIRFKNHQYFILDSQLSYGIESNLLRCIMERQHVHSRRLNERSS